MPKKRIWEFKQSAKPDTIDLYIYGDIEGDYYDWWNGKEVISETSANYFKEQLETYADVKRIDIYINSWGGSVYEAYSMCAQLQRHGAYKTAYVDGFAASAASLIPMVCDWVVMPVNAMMMIHEIAAGVYGNAKALRKEADTLDKMMESNRQLYLSKGNITEEELISMLEGETWLSAKDCKDMGFCDEITGEADMSEAIKIMDQHEKTFSQLVAHQKMKFTELKQLFEPIEKIITVIEKKEVEKEIEEESNNPNMLEKFDSFFSAIVK